LQSEDEIGGLADLVKAGYIRAIGLPEAGPNRGAQIRCVS
jgi:aryl-alcohol dehydrogenase-like predicted oxidoreductase